MCFHDRLRLAVLLPQRWLFRTSDQIARLGFGLFKRVHSLDQQHRAAVYRHRLNDCEIAEIARLFVRQFFCDCVEIWLCHYSDDDVLSGDPDRRPGTP